LSAVWSAVVCSGLRFSDLPISRYRSRIRQAYDIVAATSYDIVHECTSFACAAYIRQRRRLRLIDVACRAHHPWLPLPHVPCGRPIECWTLRLLYTSPTTWTLRLLDILPTGQFAYQTFRLLDTSPIYYVDNSPSQCEHKRMKMCDIHFVPKKQELSSS